MVSFMTAILDGVGAGLPGAAGSRRAQAVKDRQTAAGGECVAHSSLTASTA
jgi:hypothetical protein